MTAALETSRPVSVPRGAALVVAVRWTDRLIGIASTLILARLLAPADFGIVAMASLVVALVDTLLDLGVNAALVQNRDAGHDEYDTAWTLRLAQSALVAALIGVAGASLAVAYFGEPRVEAVLWVMAATVLAAGFENIGIVALQKNMEFGREFRFFFYRRLAGFAVTIALALVLRSYWAMVLGALIGRLVGVALSYAMHAYRPRLSLCKLGALWSFSQWMLVRNLGAYGTQQIDKILVGRRAGGPILGAYNLADDVAAMPVGELLAPLGRVMFPAFVRLADQPQELRRAFTLALGVQAIVALPAGVGLALVADLAVPLLLGPQWQGAIPLLQILALISAATALTHGSGYLLLALGKVRLQAAFTWAQLLLLGTLLLIAFPDAGAQGIAGIRLAVAAGAMVVFHAVVLHAVPFLRLGDMLAGSWRPVIGSAAMAGVLAAWPFAPSLPPTLALAAEVAVGATVYGATVLLLWWLSGCRAGAERYLLERLFPSPPPAAGVSSCGHVAVLPASALSLLQAHGETRVESCPQWFENLQSTVFPGDEGVRYYVAADQARCAAVLPLRLARRGPLRVVESLANFYTSLYEPPLAAHGTTADIAALLRLAAREHEQADEIRLAPMDPRSPAYARMLAALRLAGWVPFRYFCFGNWHATVDSDWPTYFRRRPGEVRSTVKRMGRKFQAAGGTLEIVQGPEGIERATAAYMEVYASSWKTPEPFPDFIPGLIRFLAASGSLRLGIAWLNGAPLAAQIWAVRGSRAAIIKLAHKEDGAQFSPGTLLTARLMQQVLEVDQVAEVDYLIGDDPYKQNWMHDRRERWGIVAYNPRTGMGTALLARELALRLAAALLRVTGLRKPPPHAGTAGW